MTTLRQLDRQIHEFTHNDPPSRAAQGHIDSGEAVRLLETADGLALKDRKAGARRFAKLLDREPIIEPHFRSSGAAKSVTFDDAAHQTMLAHCLTNGVIPKRFEEQTVREIYRNQGLGAQVEGIPAELASQPSIFINRDARNGAVIRAILEPGKGENRNIWFSVEDPTALQPTYFRQSYALGLDPIRRQFINDSIAAKLDQLEWSTSSGVLPQDIGLYRAELWTEQGQSHGFTYTALIPVGADPDASNAVYVERTGGRGNRTEYATREVAIETLPEGQTDASWAADRKAARSLVKAVRSLNGADPFSGTEIDQSGIRFDEAIGRYRSPSGNPMIQVLVSFADGGAPRPSVYALVDPAADSLWFLKQGVGPHSFGQLVSDEQKLPRTAKFKHGEYNATQLWVLEQEGRKGTPKSDGILRP